MGGDRPAAVAKGLAPGALARKHAAPAEPGTRPSSACRREAGEVILRPRVGGRWKMKDQPAGIWLLMTLILLLLGYGMYDQMPLITPDCVPITGPHAPAYQDCAVFKRFLSAVMLWLDTHTELVTAFATVVIASFTVALSVATKRLWVATVGVQRVSERALVELERPWVHLAPLRATLDVFWRHINSDQALQPIRTDIDISFLNFGKAPAVITAIHCSFERREAPPAAAEAARQPLIGNPIIPAGGGSRLATRVWMEGGLSGQDVADLRSCKVRIWLWGRVIYENAGGPPLVGERPETAFLWVFDGPNDRFAPSHEGGPDGNRRT
jgi:hypothetical protein